MKTFVSRKNVPLAVFLLLCAATTTAGAQSIYKCTQAGRVEYTDHPCPGRKVELIHQADDSEIIDQYLDLGQGDAAKRYAVAHQLEPLYRERVDAYQQKMTRRSQRESELQVQRAADEAAAAQQRDQDAHQQAIADEAAHRAQLQAENDALRQQNEQYRNQLAQPVEPVAQGYWAPPYRDHDHDHGQHPPAPPSQPVEHPCRQIAGDQSIC